jgi:hypothetical protein
MRIARAFTFALGVACASCAGGLEPVFCAAVVEPALTVKVIDDLTGENISAGATLIARDGDFVDSVTVPVDEPVLDARGVSMSGTAERPGTYDVTVRRAGFADWQRDGVQVADGRCNVLTVELTARLVP